MFKQKTMLIIRVILGIIILASSGLSIFFPDAKTGLFILIIATFGLLTLSMNFKYENTKNITTIKDGITRIREEIIEDGIVKISERNAWDIWFYNMPAVILTFLFIGILADKPEIETWKWIAVSFGGTVGLGSITSIIQTLSNLSKR